MSATCCVYSVNLIDALSIVICFAIFLSDIFNIFYQNLTKTTMANVARVFVFIFEFIALTFIWIEYFDRSSFYVWLDVLTTRANMSFYLHLNSAICMKTF